MLVRLARQLPPEGALNRALGAWWTEGLELQAVTVEIIHEQIRVAMAVAGVKEAKLPARIRVPRPTDKTSAAAPAPRRATFDDWCRVLLGE